MGEVVGVNFALGFFSLFLSLEKEKIDGYRWFSRYNGLFANLHSVLLAESFEFLEENHLEIYL